MTDQPWQSMESAPRDGTPILALVRLGRDIVQPTVIEWEGDEWQLSVCGSYASDGDCEPVSWQTCPAFDRNQ